MDEAIITLAKMLAALRVQLDRIEAKIDAQARLR